jgi:OOP family OmpA-OmpF porin
MQNKRLLALTSLVILLNGCATTGGKPDNLFCAAAGALVGGGGAAIADGDGGAIAAAAALGGLLGYIACHEAPAAPPAPEPAAPPPAPPAPEPEKDSDGDGVVDSRDACPGTPRGTRVDARGCPLIPELQGVHFDFDRAELTAEGRRILDEAARILQNNPHVRVDIVGHTDSRGSDEYNQGLSERRAESVRSYLAGRGIAQSRMTASGRGESQPIATNDTDEGRARNRRVELTTGPM